MHTIGIDLSAQPEKTACCVLEWRPESARVLELRAGFDNAALLDLISRERPRKVAIDAPFGWPLAFGRTISRFTETGEWPETDERQTLVLRRTDERVRELTGGSPLSVSSDRLAICAMRCARLLTLLADGEALDRTGAGLVAEVYPAAALRQWGLDSRGYKGNKPEKVSKRALLVERIAGETSEWLCLEQATLDELERSDHMLDALLSAMIGGAIVRGLTLPIPVELIQTAAAEGWIHLPRPEPLREFGPLRAERRELG